MTTLEGVIGAAATPLAEDGGIDHDKLVRHCRRLLALGCDGINLLGTTGEATSFSVEQRIGAMRAVARSGLPLDRFMVGTGAAALADAVRLTSCARDLAFAGALVLPPFYYKGIDTAALAGHFDALIAAVGRRSLRLYLYHFPQNSGVPLAPDTIARLVAAHGDVVRGLKDSSGDLAYSAAIARSHPTLAVFPSTESAIKDARSAGYAGCISATVNINAPLVAAAWRMLAIDPAAATARLAEASAIRAALSSVPLVAAVKWALSDLLDDTRWAPPMPPLRLLTVAERLTLATALAGTRYETLRPAFAGAGACAPA
jgi:4-hydroxy-tetrahydrodipicolinate synthase